jgi:hypothetical protein
MVRKILLLEFIPGLLAMVLCGLPFGSLIMFIEGKWLGFTTEQIIWTHLFYLSHYLAFHICAKKKDQLAMYTGQIVASIIVLCIFGPPIFFVSASLAGVGITQVLKGTALQVLFGIPSGIIYKWVLEFTRECHQSFKRRADQVE